MKIFQASFWLCALLLTTACSSMGDMETARRAALQGDYATASANYEKLADFGLPAAQVERGKQYLYGRGEEKNPEIALNYFEQAAEKGNQRAADYVVRSRAKVGALALKGDTQSVSPQQGLALLKEAAAQGNRDALFELGKAYEKGIGVTPNRSVATGYYREAAAKGHPKAQDSLNKLQASS
jgi:TPR repeat protein